MGLEENNSQPTKDNLSSVSTILGLALFCLLIATILVRRIMVHRQSRRFARSRMLAASSIISRAGLGGGGRMGDSIDDDEPRTIALGARAALMKRPMIWEEYVSPLNPHFEEEKRTGGSCWDHLQPTALQLLTPHTTAHFPQPVTSRGGGRGNTSSGSTSQRMGRAYAHFLFHRDHAAGTTAPALPSVVPNPNMNVPVAEGGRRSESSSRLRRHSTGVRSQRAITPAATGNTQQEEEVEKKEENIQEKKQEDNLYSHPVHLTFLICMPDPAVPSYTPSQPSQISTTHSDDPPDDDLTNPMEIPRLPSWIRRTQHPPPPPKNTVLTPLCLGTAHPTARLPSIRIPHSSLDSWWDLPTSPSPHTLHFPMNLNINMNTTGLSAGQILQLQNARIQRLGEERILAERAAREREEDRIRERARERELSLGVGGRGGGGVGVYEGYSGLVRAVRGYGPGMSRG